MQGSQMHELLRHTFSVVCSSSGSILVSARAAVESKLMLKSKPLLPSCCHVFQPVQHTELSTAQLR